MEAYLYTELGEPGEEVVSERHLLMSLLRLESLNLKAEAVDLAFETLDFDVSSRHCEGQQERGIQMCRGDVVVMKQTLKGN
jgi:hypothetical protein